MIKRELTSYLVVLILVLLTGCEPEQNKDKKVTDSGLIENGVNIPETKDDKMSDTVKFNNFRIYLPQDWKVVSQDVVGENIFALKKENCGEDVCPNMVYTFHKIEGSLTGVQFLDFWIKNAATDSYNIEGLALSVLDNDSLKVRFEYLVSSQNFILRVVVFIQVNSNTADVFTFTGPNAPLEKKKLFVKEANQMYSSLQFD